MMNHHEMGSYRKRPLVWVVIFVALRFFILSLKSDIKKCLERCV